MNLEKALWLKYRANKTRILRDGRNRIITNNSDSVSFIVVLSNFKTNKDFLKINFSGEIISGMNAVLSVYSFRKENFMDISLNSETFLRAKPGSRYIFVLKIDPNTSVNITSLNIDNLDSEESFYNNVKFEDFLVISPSYPSPENKYLSGFVHSRLKAYKKEGIKFTLVCAHEYRGLCKYSYEGIEVLKIPIPDLRRILLRNRFKKIAIHFFDEKYASVLDGSYIKEAQIYLWVHGPETLYWDWQYFTTPYFSRTSELSDEQVRRFRKNDTMIEKYNNLDNVTWVFVSEWIKTRSEELINIKFKKFEVIPNFIDEKVFIYEEKDSELRKEIFFLRRYDNINKYAVDINVRTILELSKRDFFKELKFNVYGKGEIYDELLNPIKNFKNVNLNKRFLNHEEISEIHKKNGVGFFPTRYDAQGVSMCEAAMSGLAIISSDIGAIREFIPNIQGNLVEVEDYKGYADTIEKLYKNPELFKQLSEQCHKRLSEKCSFAETVNKEIKMFNSEIKYHDQVNIAGKFSTPRKKILSIIVPSYNVSDFLELCIETILNHRNAGKMEVIIVNDGSTDNTLQVAKKIQRLWNERIDDSIIRIIDKENGGHGSTINVGISEVRGEFVRLIDADDWVDSAKMADLIDILEVNDSDLILTDYSEDRVEENRLVERCVYGSLTPGIKYNFEDLCVNLYGFGEWGPVLATSTFRTNVLRKTKFFLTEESPYVDMEFNMYSILNVESIVYYDLDIYRYFIGRSGQSISEESFKRNYLKHRNIFFTMIRFLESGVEISPKKREYVIDKLVVPMINSHYVILIQFYRDVLKFIKYDKELRMYPEYYNHPLVATNNMKFIRRTFGLTIPIRGLVLRLRRIPILSRPLDLLKSLISKN